MRVSPEDRVLILQIAVAVVGIGWALIYTSRLPQVRRHWRPVVAGLALLAGVSAVLAAVWSPGVARVLGRFITSAGFGGVAALGAAALALYGVLRQLEAREAQWRQERNAQEAEWSRSRERERAARHAEQFRWVCERVLTAVEPSDTRIVEFLIEDLFDRAKNDLERQGAVTLLDRHLERLNAAAPGDGA